MTPLASTRPTRRAKRTSDRRSRKLRPPGCRRPTLTDRQSSANGIHDGGGMVDGRFVHTGTAETTDQPCPGARPAQHVVALAHLLAQEPSEGAEELAGEQTGNVTTGVAQEEQRRDQLDLNSFLVLYPRQRQQHAANHVDVVSRCAFDSGQMGDGGSGLVAEQRPQSPCRLLDGLDPSVVGCHPPKVVVQGLGREDGEGARDAGGPRRRRRGVAPARAARGSFTTSVDHQVETSAATVAGDASRCRQRASYRLRGEQPSIGVPEVARGREVRDAVLAVGSLIHRPVEQARREAPGVRRRCQRTDVADNVRFVVRQARLAKARGAHVAHFPEGALCGRTLPSEHRAGRGP